MAPFECSLGYLPPLFSAQEEEIAVPLVQHHLHSCHSVWRCARSALIRATARNICLADRYRTPAPVYILSQKVWLSAKNNPLKTSSRKLSPRFLGPFEITAIINPAAVKHKLSSSLKVHPVFHFPLPKPVRDSALCPPARFSKQHTVIFDN